MDGIPVQAVGQTMSDPNAVGACPRPARPGLGGFYISISCLFQSFNPFTAQKRPFIIQGIAHAERHSILRR